MLDAAQKIEDQTEIDRGDIISISQLPCRHAKLQDMQTTYRVVVVTYPVRLKNRRNGGMMLFLWEGCCLGLGRA
jgi:hypothetical protein